jgi:PiT family inorganic phosphate transporter
VLYILIITIVLALIFELTNGFHDTANAIATCVGSKVLSIKKAIILATVFNFIGALMGSNVAKTITSGLINPIGSQYVILSALISAIIWNLITWYFGMPSSSSHAVLGGLVGAVLSSAGFEAIKWHGVLTKIFIPLIISPLIGFVIAVVFSRLINKLNIKNKSFNKLQIMSSALVGLNHGLNDAQKTMGLIMLALLSFGYIQTNDIPIYVKIVCAIVMALGTLMGGRRIIKTLAERVTDLEPKQGFVAEMSAATIMQSMSWFGIPISTTHVTSAAVIGVGTFKGTEAVSWNVVINMLLTWVVTLPATALIGALIHIILK